MQPKPSVYSTSAEEGRIFKYMRTIEDTASQVKALYPDGKMPNCKDGRYRKLSSKALRKS